MKTLILSNLLFHANRHSRDKEFYEIKNRLLSRYGKPVGYDLQEIEGKVCFHCDGSGTCKSAWCDYCWDDDLDGLCERCCGDGWFKLPKRTLLLRVKFGRFVFHQPIQSLTEDEQPDVSITNRISGYVTHEPSKYGKHALRLLYFIYRVNPPKEIQQMEFPF